MQSFQHKGFTVEVMEGEPSNWYANIYSEDGDLMAELPAEGSYDDQYQAKEDAENQIDYGDAIAGMLSM